MVPPALPHTAAASPFEVARHEDDADLRRLLRDNPMPGEITLTLEREPSCFAAARIEGQRSDFIVARSPTGAVRALGSRSIYEGFVDGAPEPIGYLAQLRVAPGQAAPLRIIRNGYRFLRHMDHHDGSGKPPVRFYVTTIIADNLRARRVLERGVPGMPTYEPFGKLVSLLLPIGKQRQLSKPFWSGRIERGATAFERYRDQIADCMRRHARRHQLARHWHIDEPFSHRTPGLTPDDFCIAVHEDTVRGCLAVWDQRPFKQVVVRGYSRRLAWTRPVYNALAPALRVPRLPGVGKEVDLGYVSHLAIDDDDTDVFTALMQAAFARAGTRGLQLLTLGLAQGNPLLEVARQAWAHRPYTSVIYLVHWNNASLARNGSGATRTSAATQLDQTAGTPHLEVATL